MTPRLGSRDRRAIRIGLLLAVPLILAIFVIRPLYSERSDLQAALDRERALLGREMAVLAAAADVREALRQRRASFGTARAVTFDGTAPLATASLTRQVVEIAEEAGLRVTTAEARDALDGGEPLRLGQMDLVASGDWRSVMDFLRAFGKHWKYMRVSSFALSGSGTMPDDGRTALQIEARVVGLIMPDFEGATSSRTGAP